MKPQAIFLRDFTYDLPADRIAHYPLDKRDLSKLLVYNKGVITHRTFNQIPGELPAESLLFFNDTRVIPARMLFEKETGATIEVFLLNPLRPSPIIAEALAANATTTWACTIGNLKRWPDAMPLRKHIAGVTLEARLVDRNAGHVEFQWNGNIPFAQILHEAGAVPLPLYIKRSAELSDTERYQTVYAHFEGAVAAPTAGLHFTDNVLAEINAKGIPSAFLTLHVSAGTFMPVKSENALEHPMHREQIIIERPVIEKLLSSHKKVVAVGTTAMRTLESLYWYGVMLRDRPDAPFNIRSFQPYEEAKNGADRIESIKVILDMMDRKGLSRLIGETSIYIVPGYSFKVCDGLITNFHQPGSTLLLLIAAFLGDDWKKVYQEALSNNYRFLSYGDSSLLLPH